MPKLMDEEQDRIHSLYQKLHSCHPAPSTLLERAGLLEYNSVTGTTTTSLIFVGPYFHFVLYLCMFRLCKDSERL